MDHAENVQRAPEQLQRRIVTPLRLLLRNIELGDLVAFPERIKVRFTLRGAHKGERDRARAATRTPTRRGSSSRATPTVHRTLRTYKAAGRGPRHALADALAEFLALGIRLPRLRGRGRLGPGDRRAARRRRRR